VVRQELGREVRDAEEQVELGGRRRSQSRRKAPVPTWFTPSRVSRTRRRAVRRMASSWKISVSAA
jgi:hypothetical protein